MASTQFFAWPLLLALGLLCRIAAGAEEPPNDLSPNELPPNELPHGDFETTPVAPEEWDELFHWRVPASRDVQVLAEEDSNHYLRITSAHGDERTASAKILLLPAWKTLLLRARVRGKKITPGNFAWENAHVGLTFYNVQGRIIGYGTGPSSEADAAWSTLQSVNEIPEGAHHAIVDVGLWNAEGEFDVDDIEALPDGVINAPPLRAGFPEGDFETLDANGQPRGWPIAGRRRIEVVRENGNRFLRLTNPEAASLTEIISYFKLDPTWQALTLSARLRASEIQTGGDAPWQNARLGYIFTDEKGLRVGDFQPEPRTNVSTDWVTQQYTTQIPSGAVFIKLSPILHFTSGTLDIDDIEIEPTQP